VAVSTAASDYLRETRNVLRAGEWLRDVIDTSDEALDDAVRRIEEAADEQEATGSRFQTLGFSSLEGARGNVEQTAEELESLLSGVVAEVDVANVLLTAGRTLGEAGAPGDRSELDEALYQLEERTRRLEQGAASPDHLGFSDLDASTKTFDSPDLQSAVATFRGEAGEALSGLIADAAEVTTAVLDELKKLDRANVLASLKGLGGRIEPLAKVGRLLRRGLKKLEQALDALIRIVGSEALARVRDRAAVLWQKITEGTDPVQTVLGWAFQIGDAEEEVKRAASSARLDPHAVDEASSALVTLRVRFRRTAEVLKQTVAVLASALAVAGLVAVFVPGLLAQLPAAAAFAYGVLLGAVLLIGLDYADSGRWLGRVEGVRTVAHRLVE
jgi:hypothetical protein